MLGVSENDKSCECLTDIRTKTCSRCISADDEDEDDIRTNCVKECVWARGRSWTKSMVVFLYMVHIASAHYTPQWAVHIVGGDEVADRIAAKHGFINLGKIFDDYYHFEHKAVRKRSLEPERDYHSNLINESEVKWAKQQIVKRRSKRDLIPLRARAKSDKVRFNDVRWPQMWYLNRGQGLDMNVQQAWQEGISGKGVVVTILDDGLEKNHPDLVRNYDPQASYDVNNHDEDPMPRYDLIDSNRHGTRCAGEVAAVANNTLCSVGVAFGASVGGVRMLDGDVTDAVEARSLSLNPQHIDIYSASWGPDDDGKTVDGPGELATRAFIEGVTKGRNGRGSIFVWASGNGGRDHDNCNCDGYTNSIWTLSISSATENGLVPWYSEACSSTLATTYSSGSSGEKQIITTDLHHQCTSGHTGTSASAPLAAGICALALEANKDLSWRDMQHIVVRTARPANLKAPDWKVNGVGRNVSHSFGYGLMDASAMVRLARSWKTVPEQHRCEVSAPHVDKLIPARSKVILNLTVTECNGVNFLEHVQAKISLSSSRRGDLQIYLTSPAGTRVTLLAKRPQDSSRNPFNAWPFMSVHTWGEMPFGIWQLEIHNEGRFLGRANLQEWSLLFYGTAQIPTGMATSQKTPHVPLSTLTSNKPNSIQVNPKPNKNSYNIPNYSNRKNAKNWKSKSATRMGKVLGNPIPSVLGFNATKVNPTSSTKNFKTTQRLWFFNKTKDFTPKFVSNKGTLKPTVAPPSTSSLPLTIVLGPSGNLTNPQKVPDVFQKYPKVQQLFPLYVNTGKIYNEENLIPKSDFVSGKGHDFLSKSNGNPFLVVQKAERQDRYDTSSLFRSSTEGKSKFQSNKKPTSRNQQSQGHFEGWQMLLYGTELAPNGDSSSDNNISKESGKSALPGDVNIEDDVPNHLDPETPNRGWKDPRHDVQRTTTEGSGSSSGCIAFSKSSSQCIVCMRGLYLYQGRCEAVCPAKTYPGINAKERAACQPCHYTCLTCVGESDDQCTSCYDEAVAIPSPSKHETIDNKNIELVNVTEDPGIMPLQNQKVTEDTLTVDDDNAHWSYGKRSSHSLVNRGDTVVVRKKAVTKKILENYNKPRPLYYCYPARMMEEIDSSNWYYRMTILFAINFILLSTFFLYYLYTKCCPKKSNSYFHFNNLKYKYSKMKNGDSNVIKGTAADNIIYVSTSEEEE